MTSTPTPRLEDYIQSSKPLLLVTTSEPEYAIKKHAMALSKISLLDQRGQPTGHYNMATWSFHGGIQKIVVEGKIYKTSEAVEGTKGKPETALKFIEEAPDNTVLFVKGFHHFLDRDEKFPQRASYIEKLRDLIGPCNGSNKVVVFVDTKMNVPEELSKDVLPVDFSLPTKAELQASVKLVCDSTGANMPAEKDLDTLLDALQGMSKQNAEDALSLSLVVAKKFDEDLIRKQKANIVAQSKVLEVINTTESLDTVAGMEIAKAWAENERECFSPEARAALIEASKAIFLVGEPGTGKSLFAKVLANVFRRNLLRLDLANVRDMYLGQSEAKMKDALATASAMSPCVLWIDEIDKGFGGASSDSAHEVTKSILGQLLTWMVESKSDVILVATANSIRSLPPELISRFSSLFWVGLPDSVQRLQAIRIHLRKRERTENFSAEDIAEIVTLTKDFSGREIENAVKAAMKIGWVRSHTRTVIAEDFKKAVAGIKPASKVKAEALRQIKEDKENMGILDASINHDAPTSTSKTGNRKINTSGVAG